MRLTPKSKNTSSPHIGRDSHGIALFMVIAAVGILAILVTEFVYIAQVSQAIAFGGLDEVKAHYLAKSGYKLSLLRLKAYQQTKAMLNSFGGGAGIPGVPAIMLQKIWSFPFFYPIPTNIPGMTTTQKDAIEKFQKESDLDGSYTALIESESSKFNMNSILPSFGPAQSTSPTPTPTQTIPLGSTSSPVPSASRTPITPEAARESLYDYLNAILLRKNETEADFATQYRDLRLNELVDGIAGWADYTYDRRTSTNLDRVTQKRAPFYSISELHMLPMMDDELYQLFAPNLTVSTTPGVNINTMKESALRALLSNNITPEEVTDFFKFRDNEEADNQFKSADDFYKYLNKVVSFYKNQQNLDNLKTNLQSRNIQLVVDEAQFKITIRAEVNTAVRTLEAWVTVGPSSGGTSLVQGNNNGNGTGKNNNNQQNQPQINPALNSTGSTTPSSGIIVNFMQIH